MQPMKTSLLAVLVGENAAGRGDALNIGQARLVRVLTQVPDNLPKADEGVIVQEEARLPLSFRTSSSRASQGTSSAMKMQAATGKNDFSNVAAGYGHSHPHEARCHWHR